MRLNPVTPEDVQEVVKTHPRLLPRGGGSKSALSFPPVDVSTLDLSGLSGIVEYEPGEYTFTAKAGTPLAEVEAALAENGQFMPFDPLLVGQGATLGGLVAADTSGPGRYRFGSVRDFLIGVRFIDGEGNRVRGGGKVVKNSAGFDLPKLMVGSLGRLGILTEVTFKIFPEPAAYATLQIVHPDLQRTIKAMHRLTTSSLDMDALDLEPPHTLRVRVGGLAEVLPDRLNRLETFLQESDDAKKEIQTIYGEEEAAIWRELRELSWVPAGWSVVKIPVTVNRIPGLEKALEKREVQRRYSMGGNIAWIAWHSSDSDKPFAELDSILTELRLSGLVLLGPPGPPRLGVWPGEGLTRRVKRALDPASRFLEI